ncbi:MAG: YdbH domain-containing protein [Hyphomonadaceae bacterium]|nr:YdbH domain-containing protein [Hyphomonadaceae bacterium]
MKEPTLPDPTPTRRRLRLVAGVAGVSILAVAGAAWFFRMPVTDHFARSAMADMGLDADFRVTRVDPGGIGLSALRIGPAEAPDAAAQRADIRLGWGLTGPRVAGLRLVEPALRIGISDKGVSLGSLDRLGSGDGGAGRLPDMSIEIVDGRVLISTPYGVLPATVTSKGRLTRDFTGAVDIAPASVQTAAGGMAGVRLSIRARTEGGSLLVESDGAIAALDSEGARLRDLKLNASAAIPREFRGASASLRGAVGEVSAGGHAVAGARLEAGVEPAAANRWRLRSTVDATSISGDALSGAGVRVTLNGAGDPSEANGEWTFRADEFGASRLHSSKPNGAGTFAFSGKSKDGAVISAAGSVTLPEAAIDAQGRREILAATPSLSGSPLGPLFGSGRAALDRALTQFSTAAAVRLDWRAGSGRLSFPGPLTAQAASGAIVTATPAESGRPVLMLLLPSGEISGGARINTEGGGLPAATLAVSTFTFSGARMQADGALRIADWRANGGRLDLENTRFKLNSENGKGRFSLDGAVAIDGAAEALSIRDLRAPLKIDAVWGGGYRITLPDGCAPIDQGAIGVPGHVLEGRRIALCPGADGVLMGEDARGQMFGGFSVNAATFSGHTDDAARKPVSFAAERIDGRFVGPKTDSHLEVSVTNPSYAVEFAPDRRIRFAGAQLTARTEQGGRVGGALTGGVFEDPAVPANVSDIAARWTSGTEGGRNVVRLIDGVATLSDRKPIDGDPPVDAGVARDAVREVTPETARAMTAAAEITARPQWIPRFNPVRVGELNATLAGSEIAATGVIDLIDGGAYRGPRKGDRRLATLTVQHDLRTGEGLADIDNAALQFGPSLDVYEITELARGVIDRVTGPVTIDLRATWNNEIMKTGGHIILDDVNLNAAALGPVTGVSGNIAFNDLALMTTPPGQTLTVKRLNPGIVVENGVIRFELRGADRIYMESAAWPFAGGVLSVDPQEVQIGEDDFRMTLALRDVDVARFLQQLELKDLTATGTVEGAFPLVFNREGGAIDGLGTLRAAPGGGTISYTGNAGSGLAGAPQIAFEALRSFRYDDLVLELTGKLDGELVTAIRFTGTNQEPVDMMAGPVATPIPGLGQIRATGLPFRFTVSVRAPFRRLMQTSDGLSDARPLVDEAIRNGTVDPAPQPPN